MASFFSISLKDKRAHFGYKSRLRAICLFLDVWVSMSELLYQKSKF